MGRFIGFIIYFFSRLLNLTYRYHFKGVENLENAKKHHPKGAYVFGFWHRDLLSLALSQKSIPHVVMISASKDGEIATTVAEKCGFRAVRGSSTRGGHAALKEMLRLIGSGMPAAISVDGPKGPSQVVKDGVVELAKLKAVGIIPLKSEPTRFWFFKKSWDRFRVPFPFTKIIVEYGTPIFVPSTIKRTEFGKIKDCLAMELNKVK